MTILEFAQRTGLSRTKIKYYIALFFPKPELYRNCSKGREISQQQAWKVYITIYLIENVFNSLRKINDIIKDDPKFRKVFDLRYDLDRYFIYFDHHVISIKVADLISDFIEDWNKGKPK